jgi:hypothetical protein
MKSFVASTTINFEGSKFYVRPGDMLSHDAQLGNSLAIYRNGQLVKVLKVDSLAIEAFLKSKFISEVKKQPAKKETKAPAPPPGYDLKDKFNNPINDLGNTPAAQADMDSLARQHDELMDQPPKPDTTEDEKFLQYKKQKRQRAVPKEVPIPDDLKDLVKETPPPLEQAEM